jgi:hypothetical protein
MLGALGRSETRASDKTLLLLREVAGVEKKDVTIWHKCVSCDSAQLMLPGGRCLQRSLLVHYWHSFVNIVDVMAQFYQYCRRDSRLSAQN